MGAILSSKHMAYLFSWKKDGLEYNLYVEEQGEVCAED